MTDRDHDDVRRDPEIRFLGVPRRHPVHTTAGRCLERRDSKAAPAPPTAVPGAEQPRPQGASAGRGSTRPRSKNSTPRRRAGVHERHPASSRSSPAKPSRLAPPTSSRSPARSAMSAYVQARAGRRPTRTTNLPAEPYERRRRADRCRGVRALFPLPTIRKLKRHRLRHSKRCRLGASTRERPRFCPTRSTRQATGGARRRLHRRAAHPAVDRLAGQADRPTR